MRSVFDQTWSQLSQAEQQVFARLSVFRDGWEREAAEQVAGASLPILAGLVEKSLPRCTDEGRYELHELLRQYGAEQLATLAVEEAETRQKHCRYYTDFLEKRRPLIENRPNPAAMAEIDRELGNIRAAWEELLAQEEVEIIAVFLEGLWRFYQQKGWFQEAVLALKQACTLAGTSSLQQACWQRRLGEAHFQMGQWAESREYLERALALLDHPLPETGMGWRFLAIQQLLQQVWHRLGPGRLGGHETKKRRSLLESALALRRFGQFVYFAGDKLRLATSALYCLNLAEQAGTSPELAEAYVICGITTGTIRLHRLARHYSDLALQTAQNIDKLSAKAYVSQVTGLYYCGICRWAEAEALFEQAASLFGQLEWRHSWAECTSLLGKVCYYQGKFGQSQQYYADLLHAAQYHGNLAAQHWGLVGQAECALRLGQPSLEQVGAWLERANALPANYPEYTQQVRLYGFLALTHLYQGNWSLAQQAAQTGAQFIKRSGFITFWAIEGYAGVAETFLTLWENNLTGGRTVTETEVLAKSARQACQALHRFARTYPLGQPRAWLYQGLYDWLVGKADRAYEAWSKSLTAAERLGMPYEQGRAHFERGRHLPVQSGRDGLNCQEHLQRAADLFIQLGAAHDLEQVNTISTWLMFRTSA
jgi:tetratricopeptide (TPR) repeat protein